MMGLLLYIFRDIVLYTQVYSQIIAQWVLLLLHVSAARSHKRSTQIVKYER